MKTIRHRYGGVLVSKDAGFKSPLKGPKQLIGWLCLPLMVVVEILILIPYELLRGMDEMQEAVGKIDRAVTWKDMQLTSHPRKCRPTSVPMMASM